MSITVRKEFEFDLYDDTWSGAKDRMHDLTDELRDQLENIIASDTEALFGSDIPEATEVNDFLWYDDDTYAEWLGFENADQMWKYCDLVNNGADEDDLYWDGSKFVTLADIESEFATYQSENEDWEDYYTDVDDYADDQGYEKFEL